jgi:formylglycine-generating enzyme required for sulfatase activity
VTLTHGFCIQATETTQAEWQRLMGTSPAHFDRCGSDCPVEQVSWLDAITYANARSRSEGLPECYDPSGNAVVGGGIADCTGYRLPTEAEWEYAARAGSTVPHEGSLNEVAWYAASAGRPMGTQPVGRLRSNAWGLYDMLGNVWEWTHDGYEAYPGGVADPEGGVVSTDRVVRGGSWSNDPHFVRASNRNFEALGYRSNNVGFRLVRSAR